MKVKLPFEPSIPAQVAGLAAMEDQDFMKDYVKWHSHYHRPGRGKSFFFESAEKSNTKVQFIKKTT
jgi:hypothetical protein